ncbi:MAG TPA: hypothetical protein VHB21_16940, partial [Minicystis sp.]|nr:hypothetical protein [Minicystis sp.]
SGQGPNQIRGCLDCTFDDVYSHGGTALRVETDGIKTACNGQPCACTAAGAVFTTASTVDGLVANHVQGDDGNNVVATTPHCLPNGTVAVSNVRGRMMAHLVAAAAGQTAAGGFADVSITDVEGCGGTDALAQDADPKHNAYTLELPESAIQAAPGSNAVFHGTLAWPPTSSPVGLKDGSALQGDATHAPLPGCPAAWSSP